MGLVPNGAASSYVMVRPELTWPVPAYWSLEDAATVPFAYVYAYYCLVIKIVSNHLLRELIFLTVLPYVYMVLSYCL